MPRNITVTFKDGSNHVYQNAPDDITPEAVQQRAMQEFNKPVASLDGGRKPAAAPAAPKAVSLKPQDAKNAWDQGSALLEQRIAKLPPAAQKIARDRFFADPRIVQLRESASRPVSVAKAEGVKAGRADRQAKRVASQRSFLRTLPAPLSASALALDDDTLAAGGAGMIRGAFGIPERIAAGVQYLAGNEENDSYSNILQNLREEVDSDLDRSLTGNILGQAATGVAMGAPIAKGIGMIAQGSSRAAPVAAALLPKVGQGGRNVARLAAAGGAGGAAQAAGEGSDVTTGAVTGAIAAPAIVGGAKGLGWLGNRAADMIGVRQVKSILRGLTSATKEELEATIENYRRQGVEPTLFEILPVQDRNKLAKGIVGRSDATVEQAQTLVRQRAGNIGPEMAERVGDVTAPRRNAIVESVARNMEEARGTGEQAGDLAVAARAAQSPLDMAGIRAGEARNIMRSVDEEELFSGIDELIPTHPELQPNGDIAEVPSDPAVAAMIQRKAGLLRLKDADSPSGGLTGENISRLLEELRATGRAGGPDADVARAAVQHIEDIVPGNFADADEAMRAAYAGRSRMIEGMDEGAATRTRETAPSGNNRARQKSVNAYDTEEGTDGRFLGQSNELRRRFRDTDPQGAARAAATLGADQRALRGNLGDDVTNDLLATADLETGAQRALAGLSSKRGAEAPEMNAGDLAGVVFGLNPQSMVRTKIWAVGRLMNLTRLPEGKAQMLVDLLLSQDPAKFQRGFNLLNTQGENAQHFMRDLVTAAVAGQQAGQVGQAMTDVPEYSAVPEAQAAEIPASEELEAPGMLEPGNIDLHDRTVVENSDGSISTVRSISVGFDDGTYLIPTVVDGRVVSNEEAIAHFKQTGEHLGKFESPEAADAYAETLHEEQAAEYGSDPDTPYGRQVIEDLFPGAHVTSDHRGPDNSIYDPNSGHAGFNAVDVRPIPGMTFNEFLDEIEASGHEIVKAYDESQRPADPRKAAAWGPHWHVEIA